MLKKIWMTLMVCTTVVLLYGQDPKTSEDVERQFDFWVGDWDVYKYGTDKLVGVNKIERILGGKAIRETYAAAGSKYEGTSLNKYNPQSGKWEQYWVDNSGLTLHIKGGIENGQMILQKKEERKEGLFENKITWIPQKDGTVRQIWETKSATEAAWKTAFDGLYKRKKE